MALTGETARTLNRADALALIDRLEAQGSPRAARARPGASRDTDDGTAAHEMIHLLAANSGLLPRHNAFPVWLQEGLAMQFEVIRGGRWAGIGRSRDLRLPDWRKLASRPLVWSCWSATRASAAATTATSTPRPGRSSITFDPAPAALLDLPRPSARSRSRLGRPDPIAARARAASTAPSARTSTRSNATGTRSCPGCKPLWSSTLRPSSRDRIPSEPRRTVLFKRTPRSDAIDRFPPLGKNETARFDGA